MEGSHLSAMFTPILWLAHFTEKNMGILQHGSGFLKGSNQKANILTSWADPARCVWWRAFRSRHEQVRCAVFTSQFSIASSHLTGLAGSGLDMLTWVATCCPGTSGIHGIFLWRPSTNHVVPSSFPLLSHWLCFITTSRIHSSWF